MLVRCANFYIQVLFLSFFFVISHHKTINMKHQYFTLGLNKLPFTPDCNQIIYVEGRHDEEVNRLIQKNFLFIRKCFEKMSFDFCYIPYLKQDLTSGERLHYTAPYAKCSREADFMINDNFILDYMVHPENHDKIPPSLLYYHPSLWNYAYTDAEEQFRGIQISASSFEGDEGLSIVLEAILRDVNNHHEKERLRFHKVTEPDIVAEDGSEEDDDGILYRSCDYWDFDADDLFDEESKVLIKEIQDRVDKLKTKGIEGPIIDAIFKNRKQKLSKLRITKDFRIFLSDYFGMEISMTPLPKAVFLLFLKHPEGIMFSYLPDFRDELLDIYKKIKGPFINELSARQSIEDVTNPLSNSINEKCSRIREAFISKFNDPLAHYYYIDGKRGEAKKIILPRTLVVWE